MRLGSSSPTTAITMKGLVGARADEVSRTAPDCGTKGLSDAAPGDAEMRAQRRHPGQGPHGVSHGKY
jgi:hypothetical protein